MGDHNRKTRMLSTAADAALEADALMHFMQKRYGGSSPSTANLGSFILRESQVVFESVTTLRTRHTSNIFEIVSPMVPQKQQDVRRTELLGKFAAAFVAAQGEGIRQVREMLVNILDDDGFTTLIEEYRNRSASD